MKRSFSIVALLAAFCATTVVASDDHYPGFYVGLPEPSTATTIDPSLANIDNTDTTPTYEEVMSAIYAVADTFDSCKPISVTDFLKLKFNKPSWVSQSCYDAYISAMADIMAHYYVEVDPGCKLANGTWDCDCLAAKRTLWLGKLGQQTLWMLLNCSYGQPSV